MTWFAWQGYNGGKAVDIAGSQEKEAVSLGFHGYGTETQAESNPNSVAGFPNPLAIPQKSFVNMIIADYAAAVKEQAQPGGKNANILNPANAAKAGGSYVEQSIPGVKQLTDLVEFPFKITAWISNRENIVRVIKVIAGTAMILVGLHMLAKDTTNIDVAGAVTSAAKKVVM